MTRCADAWPCTFVRSRCGRSGVGQCGARVQCEQALVGRPECIAKYDLWNLATVAEVRAGLNMRNIAVSADGKWVIAGNYLPATLAVFAARDLTLVKLIPVADRAGKSSRVLPHLGSGITWQWNSRPVLATPNLRDGVVSVIDMKDWKPVAAIATNGPGFFLRSHEATPYAWVDAMNSPAKDTLQGSCKVARRQPTCGKRKS